MQHHGKIIGSYCLRLLYVLSPTRDLSSLGNASATSRNKSPMFKPVLALVSRKIMSLSLAYVPAVSVETCLSALLSLLAPTNAKMMTLSSFFNGAMYSLMASNDFCHMTHTTNNGEEARSPHQMTTLNGIDV